jgi:hypothetical protein
MFCNWDTIPSSKAKLFKRCVLNTDGGRGRLFQDIFFETGDILISLPISTQHPVFLSEKNEFLHLPSSYNFGPVVPGGFLIPVLHGHREGKLVQSAM